MKQIIILDKVRSPGEGQRRVRVALWFKVPAGNRQAFYADDTKPSQVKGIAPADLAALRSGQFIEEIIEITIPAQGSLDAQGQAVQAEAERRWTDRAKQLADEDPARHYGRFKDDVTGWGAPAIRARRKK